MLKIDKHNLRVYLAGRRVHHGLLGCFLVGLGATLVVHDRHDFPWSFS